MDSLDSDCKAITDFSRVYKTTVSYQLHDEKWCLARLFVSVSYQTFDVVVQVMPRVRCQSDLAVIRSFHVEFEYQFYERRQVVDVHNFSRTNFNNRCGGDDVCRVTLINERFDAVVSLPIEGKAPSVR